MPRTAVVILTHVMDPSIQALIRQVVEDCADYSVFVCGDNTQGVFQRYLQRPNWFFFDQSMLMGLPYKKKIQGAYPESVKQSVHHGNFNWSVGSADLPMLWFCQNRADFDFYWFLEYDVRYTGNWSELFDAFENNTADLLGTTLLTYEDFPEWSHWTTFEPPDELPKQAWLRGFFPICRLSSAAVKVLDGAYQAGFAGHYECIWPTELKRQGLSIEDIGGDGEYVEPENINRYYTNNRLSHFLNPGTFAFRPPRFRAGRTPNKIWHPVKHQSIWFRFRHTFKNLVRRFLSSKP